MGGLLKWLFFLILLLSTIFCRGQESAPNTLKTKANELQEIGLDLLNEGLYHQALDTFKLFLECRKEIYGIPSYYLGRPYLFIGVTYKNLGQYKLALESFENAKQSYFEREDHQTANIAALYVAIGNVYRAKLDYKNALSYFEQALSIFLVQNPIDPNYISSVNYSMAEINYLMNNYDISIKILIDNLNKGYADNQISSRELLDSHELLAIVYNTLEKNNLALIHYQEMLKLADSVYEESDIELAMVYMNYADFLFSINRFYESKDILNRAFNIIKNVQPYRGEQLSRYYQLLGVISRDRIIETEQINRFKAQKKANLYQAIDWFNKGLNALSSTKHDMNINSVRIEDCISFLDALVLLQQIGSSYIELALLEKEDKSSVYKNALFKALDYYNTASKLTQQARREISSDDSKVQLAELEYFTFNQTIEIAYLAYDITKEDEYLELAFHNSEQLKSSAIFDKISNDIAQENSLIPDSLLQYENKLNEIISIYTQKVFEENDRELPDSSLIAELEQKVHAEINKKPDSLLIENYNQKILIENNKENPNRKLIDEYKTIVHNENKKRPNIELIAEYNNSIIEENSKGPDSVLINDYSQKIFEATEEREELNRLLEEEYSDYYDLKYSNSMLKIEDIQKDLDKNVAILEYTIVEPKQEALNKNNADSSLQLYTIFITKDKTFFNKSKIDKKLDKSLENVFSFMSTPAYLYTSNNDSKKFCLDSYDLYKLLIESYEEELTNKNLVIIPDGKLNYISFDGLIQNLPDTSKTINFSKLDYLIKDFNISYANSANILFKNLNKTQNFKNNTLAFAPEYDAEEFEISGETYTLMPLPGVQKEVDAIANTLKTKIFRKQDATEQNFRENAKDFDILHLAMHAYINDSVPAFSRLAFSPNIDEKDLNKDGWLNTSDIYNLELNARMAVLSACNTGIGKLQKGEGMMSLARGFLYAGCPSIIMSLWEVEDESGTQIMTSFYKNLKKGKPKDEALRLSKLSYLETSNSRLAHPHYWMSFKSIGDNSPIYTSYDVYFFALLIILILAFTIDQLLRINKTRNKRKDI
jgi:CHAT domain-containing protein